MKNLSKALILLLLLSPLPNCGEAPQDNHSETNLVIALPFVPLSAAFYSTTAAYLKTWTEAAAVAAGLALLWSEMDVEPDKVTLHFDEPAQYEALTKHLNTLENHDPDFVAAAFNHVWAFRHKFKGEGSPYPKDSKALLIASQQKSVEDGGSPFYTVFLSAHKTINDCQDALARTKKREGYSLGFSWNYGETGKFTVVKKVYCKNAEWNCECISAPTK